MSGGVDSSLTAAWLQDQGHEVVGVTFRLEAIQPSAGRLGACQQAARVAEVLGVKHYVLDYGKDFEESVLKPCWEEYSRGRTPNPCVLCNPGFKFKTLLAFADTLGIEWISTGHHARIERVENGSTVMLRRGFDRQKDQSYFLSRLSQEQLKRTCLVVGSYEKSRVREMAEERNLPGVQRPESQDVCFAVGQGGFSELLRERYRKPSVEGNIVDPRGNILGRHRGLHRYTVGQRKGLRVALSSRAWVKSIDPHNACVVISQDEDDILSGEMTVSGMVFNPRWNSIDSGRAEIQVRYRHRPARGGFSVLEPDRIRVVFDQPQRALTPGQAAVLYQDDYVMGSGWIETAI